MLLKKFLVGFLVIASLVCAAPENTWPVVSNTAVSTTTAYGNGVTTNFAVTFDFRANSWLVVTEYDTSVTPVTATVIPQGSSGQAGHWYPHGNVNPCVSIDMGTAPSSSQYLVLTRSIPLTQPVVFNPASIFPYAGLSSQLDQVTLTLQNLNSGLGNGGSSSSVSGGSVVLPSGVGYNLLGWNSAGSSVVNYPNAAPVTNDVLRFNGSSWGSYQLTQTNLMSLLNSSPNTPLSAASGGAGVTNSGNFTWGSNAITLTTSGTTSLTLPTSGTVLTGTTNSGNVANTIIKRDASGNFAGNVVTANSFVGPVTGNLTGNVTGDTSGTAANVTGIVAIGNGGTNSTTQQSAIDTLTGSQTSGYYLRSDGTHSTLSPIPIGDVPQGFSRLKLAQGTANTVVINDGSGNLFDRAGINNGDVLTFNGITWVSAAAGAFTIGNGIASCLDTGVADAYVCNPTPAPGAQNTGLAIAFIALNTNTGPATVNVSGFGVAAIQEPGGAPLVVGDIIAGQMVELIFDGTNYQMVSPQGPAVSANTANRTVKRDASGDFSAGTVTANLTGTATNATNVATTQVSTNASYFPLFVSSSTNGNQPVDLGTGLTFNPSTNALSTTTFIGDLTGHASLDLALTGGTMSGAIAMGTNKITGMGDPTAAQDAATKAYVDSQLSYLNPADSVYAASTTNIPGTYTNAVSGVCIGDTFQTTSTTQPFVIDGATPAIGNRVLLKDQTSTFQGGVWTLTVQAVAGVSGAIFTRALDMDTSADFNAGQIIPIINGTVNAGASYFQTATNTTCNSSAQTWTQFQKASSAYLLKANNLSDVASASTSFNNISPVTSTGDLIIGNGANSNTRLAKGTQYQTLQATATTAAYDAVHLDQSAAITGVLPVGNGGSGQSSYTNGQLLIGNTTGNTLTKATLTGGTGITITNGGGSITISSSGAAAALGVISKSSNYTAAWSDGVILCTGTFAVTLPASSGNTGALLYIKNIGTGIITITPFAGNTIDGETSQTLYSYGGVSLIPDGGTAVYAF